MSPFQFDLRYEHGVTPAKRQGHFSDSLGNDSSFPLPDFHLAQNENGDFTLCLQGCRCFSLQKWGTSSEAYPIYDSKVRDKLRDFKTCLKKDLKYTKGSLNTYEGFCVAMKEVREKFYLGPSMKRIDRYLWAWAKIKSP